MSDLLTPEPAPSLVSSLRQRLPAWLSPTVAIAGVVGVIALVAVGAFLLRSPAAPELVLPRAAPAADAAATGRQGGPPSTPPGGVDPPSAYATVHAAGAVAHPGVYTLPASARVGDVVTAAGGAIPEADLDQVNLAAHVTDGERLYVPREGETPPAVPGPAAGPGPATGPGGGSAGMGGAGGGGVGGAPAAINLNTADVAALDTLPGVGPATAAAIIEYRTRQGPFAAVDELLDVPGIGPAKLEAVRSLVRV